MRLTRGAKVFIAVAFAVFVVVIFLILMVSSTPAASGDGNTYPHVSSSCDAHGNLVYVTEVSKQGAGGDIYVVAGGCR